MKRVGRGDVLLAPITLAMSFLKQTVAQVRKSATTSDTAMRGMVVLPLAKFSKGARPWDGPILLLLECACQSCTRYSEKEPNRKTPTSQAATRGNSAVFQSRVSPA